MKNGDKFERAIVALLEERVDASGMSHSEFGRRIMDGDGVRLWRLCRAKDGKRRRLTICEAYAAAEVFGEDFSAMMWSFTQEARKRGLIE